MSRKLKKTIIYCVIAVAVCATPFALTYYFAENPPVIAKSTSGSGLPQVADPAVRIDPSIKVAEWRLLELPRDGALAAIRGTIDHAALKQMEERPLSTTHLKWIPGAWRSGIARAHSGSSDDMPWQLFVGPQSTQARVDCVVLLFVDSDTARGFASSPAK